MSMFKHVDGVDVEMTPEEEAEILAEWAANAATALEAAANAAVQAKLDQVAKARGYTNADRLASYATSTVPAWQAEAGAFIAWRDSVWTSALEILADIKAGNRQPPTIEELLDELPAITWPS